MALGTYDPAQVALVACGIPVSGFAKGTFITIEYNEEAFKLSIGSDGEGTRTRTNDNSARLTFVTTQTSASNPILSALHTLDKKTPSGDAIAPTLVKDNSGTTLAAMELSWIVKDAKIEFADESTGREWIVETDNLDQLVGSN